MVKENLLFAFPDKSLEEITRLEKAFYRNLCDCFFETIKGYSCSLKSLNKRMVYTNMDILPKDKDIIVLACHTFNWEWNFIFPTRLPKKINVGTFYHPSSNQKLNHFLVTLRSRFGVKQLNMMTGIKKILEWRMEKKPFVAYFLADQSPTNDAKWFWTTFFNRDTSFMTGAESLARKIDGEVFFVSIEKVKRGHYETTFYPLKYDKNVRYSLTENYVKMCEKAIEKQPDIYLWSHNRWKHKKPVE